MRVLVVSHNVFSKTESMGKTLSSYFINWEHSQIAQFFIHSEVPVSTEICENYFRITDVDAFKSIFLRNGGRNFAKEDVAQDRIFPRTDSGVIAKIYQKGRKRTPLIYLIRNAVWRLSKWKNKSFKEWVNNFDPDIIFLASGDYSFLYRIALEISKWRKIPMVVSCMDDYYFNNKNEKKILGKISHYFFMKQVRKTLDYASAIFCICDKMTKDYGEKFGWKCFTLHTPSNIGKLACEKKNNISYIGNLGYQRHVQLVRLGKALKSLNYKDGPKGIDVYSAERRTEILANLTEENGIFFHGQISAEKVKGVIGESVAVVHVESFEEEIVRCVKYSVSTKIADSLASGTCILAYGPSNIASIEYLSRNKAAYVISSEEEIQKGLEKLVKNERLRSEIERNAWHLAELNHNHLKNAEYLRSIMEEIISLRS